MTMPQIAVDLADPDLYRRGIPHDVFASIRATPGLYKSSLSR